jgi:histidinol-phosphate/aromatic aminotransferase/cobyric acid decarboxylase-like protein
MYQLNKKQTFVLLQHGKVMFLYKTLQHKILITIYRDQITNNGCIRIPVKTKNNNFRLMVTIPYYNQLKDTVKNK